jgi:hypothetical protein
MTNMPVLRPLPILTKGQNVIKRAWRWFTSIRKWQVVEDYVLSFEGRRLIIPAGFVFDGASIPRVFWSVLSPTGLLLIPGIFHDYGYRYDHLWEGISTGRRKCFDGAGKAFWDRMFMRLGQEINGVHFVNAVAWAALAIGGFAAWKGNRNLGYDRHPEGRGEEL